MALKRQLAIGGRLVIPVGEEERSQTLIKLIRKSNSEFEEENLGAVAFVPLIGEQGWAEDGRRAATNHLPGQSRGQTLPELIANTAEPLPELVDPAFGRLFDIRRCLDRAAEAERLAACELEPAAKAELMELASSWRNVAADYQYVQKLDNFLKISKAQNGPLSKH